jgi:hypothetical protein
VSRAAKPSSEQNRAQRSPTDLLYQEVRREGKVIALFRGIASDNGVTVETRVFPVKAVRPGDDGHVDRPFPFSTLDQARRFVDDSIVALEYLGCTVTE